MNISKINAYSPVAFQGKTATKTQPHTFKIGNKEIETKKAVAGVAAVGVTVAGLLLLINRMRKGKTPVFVPGSWEPKKNIGAELETFNKSVQRGIRLNRTAEINEDIARVAQNTAKTTASVGEEISGHRAKALELVDAFKRNETVSRADLDIEKAKAEAAKIMEDLTNKAKANAAKAVK